VTSTVDSVDLKAYDALRFMEGLLAAKNYDQFIRAESSFYMRFIRSTETHQHHDAMFRLLEPLVSRYGDVVRGASGPAVDESNEDSVCYFLPSLDNDLAHIELLANILRAGGRERERKIYIAGFSDGGTTVGSRNISDLATNYRVTVVALKQTHQALVEFSRWFFKNKIGLLVHYSIPTLLPVWLSVFGPDRVAWYITKFELESFTLLRHGISGVGTIYQTIQRDKVSWRRAPAALPVNYLFNFKISRSTSVRAVSVNREKKLRNPKFLESVSDILLENVDVEFYWTGRERDLSIVSAFAAHGLSSRNRFLGWVNHVELLPKYDVFLDTFGLSGMVAASAFSSGMPVMFMRDSGSWLESFEEEIISELQHTDPTIDRRIAAILADSPEDYVAKASDLICRIRCGEFDGSWQREVGQSWFFNSLRAYERHDRALREILSAR